MNVALDLPRIEAALRVLKDDLDRIDAALGSARDRFDARLIDNMIAGYGFVGTLVADGIDLFAIGESKHWLELNCIVLCGTDPRRRAEHARHLAATERRFYEERDAGIEDILDWNRRNLRLSVWDRAAGVYVRILAKPQLFIEGNHRTGALVMSYVLMRCGEQPFVLSAENALAYFAVSGTMRDIHKNSLTAMIYVPLVRKRLARLLRAEAKSQYLCTTANRGGNVHPVNAV